MKPTQIIAFLAIFLISLTMMQSLIQLGIRNFNFLDYFQRVLENLYSLFFAILVAIPVTVIILKKYEKNGK